MRICKGAFGRSPALAAALLTAGPLLSSGALAATLTVTSSDDSGVGSLRDAIAGAPIGAEIVFDASLAGQPVVLTTGELVIHHDLTIRGLGRDLTILDGNGASRIIRIEEGASVTISDLTVRNGRDLECLVDHRTRSEGGGIYNAGFLQLDRSIVRDNRVNGRESHCDEDYDSPESIRGGGIYNVGTLFLNQTSIDANSALGSYAILGGGLYNAGEMLLTDSSVNGNSGHWDRGAGLQGSGIYNDTSGTATLIRCGVVGNTAAKAIENAGSLTVLGSTIAGNEDWRGGGMGNSGVANLTDTLLISNRSGVGSAAAGILNTGWLTLERSTVGDNRGEFAGGLANQGVARLINSTIFRNEGYWLAGGVSSSGTMVVSGTTIAGNITGNAFAGMTTLGLVGVTGTIIAGNYNFNDPAQADCGGRVTSLGHNHLGLAHGCDGVIDGVNGDLAGVDWSLLFENDGMPYGYPLITLSENGGPTPTVALLPGSPAIDAIPEASCMDADGNPLRTDERGVARPQGGACDVGAFEFSAPRGIGFWSHQCSGRGYAQLAPTMMQALFDQVSGASPVFPECAAVGCDTLRLETPQNDMREKAERELLGLWLNVITGRATRGRPVNLPALTNAQDVGKVLAEVETTVCDADASRGDLGTAKEIAEAINNQGEDMELVAAESSGTLLSGGIRSFTLAVVNMSPDVRSYDLAGQGTWPATLSQSRVNGLAPGQIALFTATVSVSGASPGATGVLRVTAADRGSETSLERTATIRILVGGAGQPSVPGGRSGRVLE
jgi:hypothetical protein